MDKLTIEVFVSEEQLFATQWENGYLVRPSIGKFCGLLYAKVKETYPSANVLVYNSPKHGVKASDKSGIRLDVAADVRVMGTHLFMDMDWLVPKSIDVLATT